MARQYSAAEVAIHNNPSDLYIIIDDDVYDLTNFQNEHPGGKKILSRVAGTDASKQFWKCHNEGVLRKYKPKLLVGSLDSKKKIDPAPENVPVKSESQSVTPVPALQENSKISQEQTTEAEEDTPEPYGDMIPFADPMWYQGVCVPFIPIVPSHEITGSMLTYLQFYTAHYDATHIALRYEIREWATTEIEPYVDEWERTRSVPVEIYKAMGTRGYFAGLLGMGYLSGYTTNRIASVTPEKWDLFHELLVIDEMSRIGSGGVVWNIIGGFCIGCPPLARFGQESLKKRVLPQIFNGDKRICLAITEPGTGSDVASLACEAVLSEDGKHYIINGEKKWITNGLWSDYFTTAVRTGTKESGMKGLSVFLIERSFGGVSTRKMDCQGVWSSGTSYVTFEDVKVPVENLIGKENGGFKVLMANFNHERMGIIIQCLRFSRVCYEESVKYAHKRQTFGKALIEHPVIRLKLAHMVRQIEASYAWLESIAVQLSHMSEELAMLRLGGAIASLKAQSTITFEFCAREASQIFGGLSYTQGGLGGKVERLYRDVRAYAIPGGSEEIMLDLSIRQSLKVAEMTGMKL